MGQSLPYVRLFPPVLPEHGLDLTRTTTAQTAGQSWWSPGTFAIAGSDRFGVHRAVRVIASK